MAAGLAAPLDLGGATPKLGLGTSARTVPPQQTLERVSGLLPVMGITRLANVTGLDTVGLPVVVACRPNSRSLAVAQGKGATLAAAKASALMESIEGYHAERIERPLLYASYDELRCSRPVVDPLALPRLELSAFRPGLRMLWIEAHDLASGEGAWLPFEVVHTDFTLPMPAGSGCFVMSSNGLASGNHRLEALSHGICETVERDAWTLWSFREPAEQDALRLDLDTVDDDGCREVLARYERAGLRVAVWEITTDVGIACFLCTLQDREPGQLRRLYTSSGAGCHPDRTIALFRALAEAAQSRLTLISGSRDDSPRSRYDRARDPDTLARNAERLAPVAHGRRFDRVPTFESDTLEDDVAHQLRRLDRAGFSKVLWVDLTRPELRIPVVRVVVPGLEGVLHAPGYLPGRRARAVAGGRA